VGVGIGSWLLAIPPPLSSFCHSAPCHKYTHHTPLTLTLCGRPHRLGLHMVVCEECLPAPDKPWDRGVCDTPELWPGAAGLCARVRTRVCWCRRIYYKVFTHIYVHILSSKTPAQTQSAFFLERPKESVHTNPHSHAILISKTPKLSPPSSWSVRRRECTPTHTLTRYAILRSKTPKLSPPSS